jgi:hypothetical protein
MVVFSANFDHTPNYHCPNLDQSGLFLPYSHRIERKSGIFQSKVDGLTRPTVKEWLVVQFIKK